MEMESAQPVAGCSFFCLRRGVSCYVARNIRKKRTRNLGLLEFLYAGVVFHGVVDYAPRMG